MKPKPVSDLEHALGGRRVVTDLMPPMADIPEVFRHDDDSKWHQFQRDWFFLGLKQFDPKPKPGIDPDLALRHLSAIQRSLEPKHEHKAAAVAYLASLWFEDIEWEVRR